MVDDKNNREEGRLNDFTHRLKRPHYKFGLRAICILKFNRPIPAWTRSDGYDTISASRGITFVRTRYLFKIQGTEQPNDLL